jgi:predicted acylesterase/phospholipase RssA
LPDVKVWHITDTSQVVDLSIASSGGVSIGAYQAGVSWMFAELLKFLRDNPAQRDRFHLPSFRIAALSGASAGNINSLLMALQSCDASPARPAESSAFWDVWMQAGLPQLLPQRDSAGTLELGLLDRTYFNTVLKARLNEEFGRLAVRGCFIPIVAMMSKLLPSQFQLNRFIGASVQRYVASYSLASEEHEGAGGSRFVMRPPEALVQRDTALGKQISMLSHGERPVYYDFDQVFELLKASSSVVYLFAPIPLAYCDAGAAAEAGGCDASLSPAVRIERSRFVDGGVIDNAPLFAAMRLMTLRDSLAGAREADRGRREHGTLFVSYGARRQHEPPDSQQVGAVPPSVAGDGRTGSCRPSGKAERCGGIGAFLQFMDGFLAASTQYELQWLVRLRAQDPSLRGLDVDVTTRYAAIAGEHLKNASSFLGRPFREFDFQVGVYDALHFVATALLCLPEHRQTSDSSGTDHCVIDTVRGLVDRFPLSCQSSLAIDLLLRKEYRIESSETLRERQLRETAHCGDTSRESAERALAYRSIFEAVDFVNSRGSRRCQGRGTISAGLCADGTIELFDRLRQDRFFYRYIERETLACRRTVSAARSGLARRHAAAQCFADDEFLGALRDPQHAFFTWFRRLLDRAQWLEEEVAHQQTDGDPLLGLDAVTQTMNVMVRTALLAEEQGLMSFPTIVPQRRNAWRVLTGLVSPQELAFEAIGSGSGYYWHPISYRWKSGFAWSVTAGVIKNTFARADDSTARSRGQARATASLLVGYRPVMKGNPLLSGIEGGVRYWMPSRKDEDARASSNRFVPVSPELKVDLLWDRVSVRLSQNPGFGSVEERRRVRASVSFNDLGGLLYWIVRSPSLR